jgi:GGDEF domain-containing protein
MHQPGGSTGNSGRVTMTMLYAVKDHDDELLALLDPVTRLPGRGLFLDRCAIALTRARRSRTSLGLISITSATLDDCDAATRDVVRRRIAVAALSVMRADDTVARFDDRFVIVCNELRNAKDLATITTRLGNVLQHQAGRVSSTLVDPMTSAAELLDLVDRG